MKYKTLSFLFGYSKTGKTTNMINSVDNLIKEGVLDSQSVNYYDLDRNSRFEKFKRDYMNNKNTSDNNIVIIDTLYPMISAIENIIVKEYINKSKSTENITSVHDIPYGIGVSKMLNVFKNKIENMQGNIIIISHCRNKEDEFGRAKKDIFFVNKSIIEYLVVNSDTIGYLEKGSDMINISKKKYSNNGSRIIEQEQISIKEYIKKIISL